MGVVTQYRVVQCIWTCDKQKSIQQVKFILWTIKCNNVFKELFNHAHLLTFNYEVLAIRPVSNIPARDAAIMLG